MENKQTEFLGLFHDPVFINIDEDKREHPRHTVSLEEVISLNATKAWGAYFSVNGFADFIQDQSRTIESCTSLNAHFVEIDRPGKSTQEIANEATELAANKGISFTCLVKTGRGVHGYWVLKEPILKPNEEQVAVYRHIQDELTMIFGGDKQARDISRVLRIPHSKYWKDGSGREIEIGKITDHRYGEEDFLAIIPSRAVAAKEKGFTPMTEVMYATHGERHGKSFHLALKISNQFDHSHDVAHTIYRTVIENCFEKVAGDGFHEVGGEADKQFESAWQQIKSNPRRKHDEVIEPDQLKVYKEALSIEQLLTQDFPGPVWAVEKLFESSTINMISARPNHYKSWFTLAVALAAARGEKLFGVFPTTKQSVMFVNEEDSVRSLQSRIKMLDDASISLPIHFHVQQELKLVDSDVDQLIKEAQEKKITMIVFDSLRAVHDKDENSSQEAQDIMNKLKRFTRKGITVLFTHHNRKKPVIGNTKEDGEESRGSSGINAAVHGHLSLVAEKIDGQMRIIVRQQKLKGDDKIKPFKLVINPMPWGFKYDGEHQEAEFDQTKTEDDVLTILISEGSWLSVDDLIAAQAGGNSSVRQALKGLVMNKKVEMKKRKDVEVAKMPTFSSGAPSQNLYHALPDEDLKSFVDAD